MNPAYVFLDEGGNLDFSANGTTYFTITSVLKFRPFSTYAKITDLRYDLIETGLNIEYFHASEDRQAVRDKVFEIIKNDSSRFIVDSVIAEKRKTGPALQAPEKFYPQMLGYLLRYVLGKLDYNNIPEVIVITDRLPVSKKKDIFEKSVKTTLKEMLPTDVKYRILHHDSKSACGLQVADYYNWAIFRKWERNDSRSFDIIYHAVRSQFEIFRRGTRYYY
jgi:hypothetical protein